MVFYLERGLSSRKNKKSGAGTSLSLNYPKKTLDYDIRPPSRL
jgi:hypothetical protein